MRLRTYQYFAAELLKHVVVMGNHKTGFPLHRLHRNGKHLFFRYRIKRNKSLINDEILFCFN